MRKISIALLLLIAGTQVLAEQYRLTEESVIELAVKRNEQIGIARQEIEQANEKLSSAYSNLFPVLSITAGVSKADGSGNFAPNAYDWRRNASIRLTQPIYTFGKISSGIDITKSAQKISELNSVVTTADVINTARKLYYVVLFNRDLVEITTQSYKNAVDNKNALEGRVSFGRISRNDNLKMQADLASRKPEMIVAKKNLETSILDLKNFLALSEDDKVKIIHHYNDKKEIQKVPPSLSKLEETVDVKILKENVALSDLSIDLAKSQRLPDLALFGSYSPTTYRDSIDGDILKEQSDLTIGLSLTFDWDLGGSKNSEVAVKRSQAIVAKLQFDQVKRNIKTEYLKLEAEFDSLNERAKAEQEAVKLAASSYKVALSAFKTGGVSQLQLNDSEQLLTRNRLSLAQTKLRIKNTYSDMERLLTSDSSKQEGDK